MAADHLAPPSVRTRSAHRPSRRDVVRAGVATVGALAAALATGCDVRAFAYRHGAKRRLSIATAGTGGVMYVYGGGIAKIVSEHVPNTEMTAEVTPGTVDNMKLLTRGAVDLALMTGDVLDDAVHRRDAFARAPVSPARSIATLYAQPVHVATFDDLGIRRLADLRGRRVSTGAPGSGTETAALRVLAAAGLHADRDLRRQRLSFAASAEALKDGKIDACFVAAGAPNSALLDVASVRERRMRLVPLDDVLPTLQRAYGAHVYLGLSIPGRAYPGIDAAVPVVGVNNVLVADERLDEALVHEITRVLFEHKAELVAVHRSANELTLASAVTGASAPFHPGAIRYYREVGAWR